MKTARLMLLILLAILTLPGCAGEETPVVVPDREAVDTAVQRYLAGKSMDLAIDEYRSFEMSEDGAAATAVIALGHGGEGYANLRVRYEFTFQKVNDRWQVTRHRQVKE